ncbi:hypothetical protein [Dethiosulfatarculus sandiegensis]|uniref:Aminomethyltransferase folate-binding domain-containing protein n=1 Tax=Dethiosulfatarculus sandiegensis TaxID=1429043 RepID=A0A0D2JP50_9BACT|nr:hypothetical protein [Dethiosulfatarculus sandiegensis]KIX11265.1 hypothetical protein X474_26145 [Dethiosulfatarculus sandiegensis]
MITMKNQVVMPSWAGSPVVREESGWPLVMEYEPKFFWRAGLVDLSHRPKALLCGRGIEDAPELSPGRARLHEGAFYCRINQDETAVFDLKGELNRPWPDEFYTDMTHGWLFFALLGKNALPILQRLAAVDVEQPGVSEPLYQNTKSHNLWLQIINPKFSEPGFFLACDRSHGQNLLDGLLRTGRHLGLRILGLGEYQGWAEKVGI